MKYSITKLSIIALTCIVTFVTGCAIFSKTPPTIETMDKTARSVGTAAALVANMTNIDNESRTAVAEIITLVQTRIPAVGESFSDAWLPIAEQYIDTRITENKISELKGKCIITVVKVAFKGIDYLIDKRYPIARQYTDLVNTAIVGFCDSFLSKFNTIMFSSTADEFDEDAFEYLKDYYFQTVNQ